MKIFILTIFLMILIKNICALSLSDFVPSFLYSSASESANAAREVHPFVDIKRNASSTRTWYCTRMQNNVSNVFCDKESSVVAKSIVYGNKNDTTQVVDNAVSTNDSLNQSMNQRTTVFQDPKVTNLLLKDQDQIQNSALIPLQPSKDVHMGINAQQVEFNIQY